MNRWIAIAVAASASLLGACREQPAVAPPEPVAAVDVERYLGVWYEIARLPHRFQRQCASDVSATYSRRAQGGLHVVNRCRTADGSFEEARAIARIADPISNARLEVSFFSILGWRPVWGRYWILELADDYHYAIIGEPERRYGWILARTPVLSAADRRHLDDRLRELGYDPARFVDTRHTTGDTAD